MTPLSSSDDLQHHGRGTVAEQHGYIAVVPVHVLGDQFDADHQGVFDDAGLDHRRADRQAVHEAGTCGIDVECCGASRADALLHAGGAVGHRFVVAAAAVNHEIDILAAHPGAGDGAARRDDGEFSARHMRNSPFLHAGAGRDPLVIGGEKRREIMIGQDGRWQAFAPADDGSVSHFNSPSRPMIRTSIVTEMDAARTLEGIAMR